MNGLAPEWTAIVVNQDGGEMLRLAIESIEGQTKPPAEIVVVDNGSSESERSELRRWKARLRLVELERNLGFAGGTNAGLASVSAPWVAFVNNDVILARDWAEKIFGALSKADWPVDAAQGAVLDEPGAAVDSLGITFDETLAAIPAGRGWLAADAARMLPFEILGPSATAAIYSTAALERAGGGSTGELFPQEFFAYYEDVDLVLRMVRLGSRSLAVPSAVARHRGSVTGDRRPGYRRRLLVRNRLWTLRRNFDVDSLERMSSRIARGTRRAIAASWRGAGFRGLAGALSGRIDASWSSPPPDRLAAPRLDAEALFDSLARLDAPLRAVLANEPPNRTAP